jgi:hypothetical protein
VFRPPAQQFDGAAVVLDDDLGRGIFMALVVDPFAGGKLAFDVKLRAFADDFSAMPMRPGCRLRRRAIQSLLPLAGPLVLPCFGRCEAEAGDFVGQGHC